MTGFLIWAALCALAAAACIAWPLLRGRADGQPALRPLAMAATAVLLLAAAVLYPLWSHYPWRQGPPQTAEEGIAPLLAATVQHPDAVAAWLDLGRAYLRAQQLPLARRSFQRADRLSNGSSAMALSGIAQTMVFEGNGERGAAALKLFERALQLDPQSPQALFYTGLAALQNGDFANARARFVALRDQSPPASIVEALDRQIAAIDEQLKALKPDPATALRLRIRIAAPLQAAGSGAAALFVFVRSPQGGPPLAVKRLAVNLPQDVALSAADAVMAGNGIKPGQKVQIVARLSMAGTPLAASGDLSGEIAGVAGQNGTRDLVIDRRTP